MAGKSRLTHLISERMIVLYERGWTDLEVAQSLGITVRTIQNWKKKNPEFFHSIKQAKGVPDQMVEQALFNRAIGYSHPEEKIFCSFGKVIRVQTVKHYPPDPEAGKFWLHNRQPDRWRKGDSQPVDPLKNVGVSTTAAVRVKKTFEQFCDSAGYPAPFPRQHDMKDFFLDGTDPRLLLGARGYGKTDYVTILSVAYSIYCDWFDNPEGTRETNLIITKSKPRNTAIINEIASALENNGVPLEVQNSNVIKVQGHLGKDASVEVLTIKSSFRGRHPKRLIMDDPVTEEDVSKATRELVKRKYNEAYKLCKNILIIGQPAHALDLYADLRNLVAKLELPHGSIIELDADLEAMKLAGVDQASIEMSYHLRIPVTGSMPFQNIKALTQPFGAFDSVAFIDPSHEGGDHTALAIGRGYGQGFSTVGFTWKKSWDHCLPADNEKFDINADNIVSKLVKYGVKKVCIETNGLGNMPVLLLRKLLQPHGIVVAGRRSNDNKHSRIMAAGTFAQMIHLSPESSQSYTDQVKTYEYKAEPDDAPDALATMLEWIGMIEGKQNANA